MKIVTIICYILRWHTSFLSKSDIFDTILLAYHCCQHNTSCTNCSHDN